MRRFSRFKYSQGLVTSQYFPSSLKPFHSIGKPLKHTEIDAICHCLVTGRIHMQVIARVVLGRNHLWVLWIPDNSIKIKYNIELATGPDPGVHPLPCNFIRGLGIRLDSAVRANEGCNRRSEEWNAKAVQSCNHLLIRLDKSIVDNILCFSARVGGPNVIDAFKHHYSLSLITGNGRAELECGSCEPFPPEAGSLGDLVRLHASMRWQND